MQTRIFIRWLCTFTFALIASACQSTSEATNAPNINSTDSGNTLSTPVEDEGPIEVDLEVGPGDFFLSDPQIALDELSSYTESLVISVDGSQSGRPQPGTTTYLMLHTKEPLANQLNIVATGETPSAVPPFMAELNGVAYELNEEGKCTANDLDPAVDGKDTFLNLLQPNRHLLGVFGAELAGQETVNGLPAEHYIFDQRALIEAGISEASGELWIASEGGLLLKYTLSLTGTEDFFGEGNQGVMTWDYEISEINSTTLPALPDNCKINVPLLEDADNIIDIPGWLAFDTAFSVQDASAFYQQELSALGWQLQPDQAVYDIGVLMEFAKDGQTLILSVSIQDGGTTRVNIAKAETEEIPNE